MLLACGVVITCVTLVVGSVCYFFPSVHACECLLICVTLLFIWLLGSNPLLLTVNPENFVVCMQRQEFSLCGSVQQSVARAISLVGVYLPLFTSSALVVLPLLAEVMVYFASCQLEFVKGGAESRAFSEASSFPGIPESLLSDAADTLCNTFNNSLELMILHQHVSSSDHRFNADRCRDVFVDDPEFDTLMDLATVGAVVPIPDDFVIQSTPEPLRQLHMRLGQCIPKHAFKLWEDGKALLFRLKDVVSLLLHFNNSHWTSKPFVDEGRYLFDCANIANGSTINSAYAFDLAEQRYLPLHHPTIIEILTGALLLARNWNCDLSDLRLWKDDIKSAFGQFNMDPSVCYLLATQIAAGIVMIYIAGMFGYHACPLIFGVFSRAISRVLHRVCQGSVFVYVDDLIGFSHFSVATADQAAAQDVILRTFGPSSLAKKSFLPSLSGDVLGWFVDLGNGLVRPNDRAIRKLMFAFFTVDLKAKRWPLQQCQMLASLAQRYSLALRGMHNFVQPLHSLCGLKNQDTSHARHTWRNVSSQAKFAVEMWRMVAICLYVEPLSLAVPIASLCSVGLGSPDYYVISDAGPDMFGFAVYSPAGVLLWYSALAWPFERDDNFQNAKEFLAFLACILDLIGSAVFHRGCNIHWTGDNVPSLSWVDSNRCKSNFAQRAFIAFTFLCLRFQIQVVEVKHRPGILMGAIDSLSRGYAHDLDPLLFKSIDESVVILRLLAVCNPALLLEANLMDHHEALLCVFDAISALV